MAQRCQRSRITALADNKYASPARLKTLWESGDYGLFARDLESSFSAAEASVGIVLFPNLTQLDITGPYEVLSAAFRNEGHSHASM